MNYIPGLSEKWVKGFAQGYPLDCWIWDFRLWKADIRIFVWRCNHFSLFRNKVFAELISWIPTVSWFITKPFLLNSYCSRGTFYISCFFDTLRNRLVPTDHFWRFIKTAGQCHLCDLELNLLMLLSSTLGLLSPRFFNPIKINAQRTTNAPPHFHTFLRPYIKVGCAGFNIHLQLSEGGYCN